MVNETILLMEFKSMLMDSLRKEQDKLELEQENTNGDYEKMKIVFEKKVPFL
jgi:hypothetical protein